MPKEKPSLKTFLKSTLGVRFVNVKQFEQAFVHKSVSKKHNNERLEFLGDAVLSAIITEYLYHKYPKEKEGRLTQMKSNIVNRKQLNNIGQELNLLPYIRYNETPRGHKNILGNVLESLIGALFLAKGYNRTKRAIIHKLVIPYVDFEDIKNRPIDYKSEVIIWGQKNKKEVLFNTVYIESEYLFESELRIDDKVITKAKGETKKRAEKQAAEQALIANLF